jgi:phospholipid transport system substrate-binding protein
MRFVALLLVLLHSFSSLAEDLGPEELVRKVTDEVLETLHNDKLLQVGDRKAVITLFEQKVAPLLDFREGARIALGPAWRTASLAQQERIVREFRTMLVRIYSNMISAYRGQTMRVVPLKLPSGATEATVRNQYTRPGRPPVPVDYAMHKTAAGWRIYDIQVDGVSLVLTYRSEFEQVIKQSGIEGLIRSMTEKNLPPVPK